MRNEKNLCASRTSPRVQLQSALSLSPVQKWVLRQNPKISLPNPKMISALLPQSSGFRNLSPSINLPLASIPIFSALESSLFFTFPLLCYAAFSTLSCPKLLFRHQRSKDPKLISRLVLPKLLSSKDSILGLL